MAEQARTPRRRREPAAPDGTMLDPDLIDILGAGSLLKKTDKQRDPRDYTSYVHAHQPHEGAAGA